MHILVEPLKGETFTLDVEATDSIDIVKAKIIRIQAKEGILSDEIFLFYAGEYLLPDLTLCHYNIQHGFTLQWERKIPIKVTTLGAKIFSVTVEQSLTVLNLKTWLELEDGTPREQQQLVLGETVMEDWCRLYDYDIQKDTILQLVKNQKRKRMFFVDDSDEDGETDDEFENDEEEDE